MQRRISRTSPTGVTQHIEYTSTPDHPVDDMVLWQEQDLDPHLRFIQKLKDMHGGVVEDDRIVAHIPDLVWHELVKKGCTPDKDPVGFAKWLDDPDNSKFRVWGKTIGRAFDK